MNSVKQHKHRGDILKAAVKASGMTIDAIMKRMGYDSRNTYYYHTKQAELPLDILQLYAKALRHDFSDEIEELSINKVSEPETPYLTAPATIEEAIRQRDFYVRLYWKQLEDYRKLEEEYNEAKIILSKNKE